MLDGLRVAEVDLGDSPVSVQFAGKMLVQLGARVDTLSLSAGSVATTEGGPIDGLFDAFLADGKVHSTADGHQDGLALDAAVRLLDASHPDVIVVGHEGGLSGALHPFLTAVGGLHPQPHVVVVTPFGMSGQKCEWFGSSLIALAAGGSAYYQPAGVSDGDRERPLQLGVYAGDLAAGVTAAVAALAGLFDRDLRDVEYSDISVHDSVLAMGLLNSSWVTHTGTVPSRIEAAGRRGVSLGLLRCKDGRFSLLPVHESQWERWVTVMGDPEWAQSDLFTTRDGRNANKDALQHFIEEWAAPYTKDEIWRMGQASNVPVFPVHTPTEVVRDRQMTARGFFETVRADEPNDRLVPTNPLRMMRSVPAPGVQSSSARAGSLSGLKVLDLSWVLAGPHATSWLGYMGADVIRLESSKRLDQFRATPPFRGVDRDPNQAGGFHHINQNKRSVAIDLTHPRAREVVLDLAEQADVLVENFGAGLMERFGLSETALRERRPDLIIASSSGLGRTGPDAGMRAYGQTIHAYAGLAGRVGYAPDDIRGIVGTWADPLTGVFQVAAILSALRHRSQTSTGVSIDLSMAECAIFGTIPDVFVRAGAGEVEDGIEENCSRRYILNDTYRCRGNDAWIAISVRTAQQLRVLQETLGLPASESVPDRDRIERASRSWDAEALAALLQQLGVAAHRVNDAAQAIHDVHGIARGTISLVHDPAGPYLLTTMPWRRLRKGGETTWPLRPAPRLGEHTNEVLREWLGLAQGDIDSLTEEGVLK